MSQPPAILPSITRAVRDGLAVAAAMPALCVATLAVFVVEQTLVDHLRLRNPEAGAAPSLLIVADMVLYSLMATPISVATYRFLIDGERCSFSVLSRLTTILLDSFVALALLLLFASLPLILADWVETPPETFPLALTAAVVATVIFMATLMRFALLFPAVAVRGQGATLRSAWRLMSGLTWRFIVIALVIGVPPTVAILSTIVFAGGDTVYDLYGAPALVGALNAVETVMLASVAARFYIWRTARD